MGKIMAIGGGDITDEKSIKLSELLVSMSEKKRPRFLFFSAASEDDPVYISTVRNVFSKLGCKTDELTIVRFKHFISREFIKTKIDESDIVLIGDGDVKTLLKVIQSFSIDKMLNEFISSDGVLAGIGRGGDILFSETVTGKSYSSDEDVISFHFEKGLGYIPGIVYSGQSEDENKLLEGWYKDYGRIKGTPKWSIPQYNALLLRGGELRGLTVEPKSELTLTGFKSGKLTSKVLGDGEAMDPKNLINAL